MQNMPPDDTCNGALTFSRNPSCRPQPRGACCGSGQPEAYHWCRLRHPGHSLPLTVQGDEIGEARGTGLKPPLHWELDRPLQGLLVIGPGAWLKSRTDVRNLLIDVTVACGNPMHFGIDLFIGHNCPIILIW